MKQKLQFPDNAFGGLWPKLLLNCLPSSFFPLIGVRGSTLIRLVRMNVSLHRMYSFLWHLAAAFENWIQRIGSLHGSHCLALIQTWRNWKLLFCRRYFSTGFRMMKFRFRRQGNDPQREKLKQDLFAFNKVRRNIGRYTPFMLKASM